MAKYEVRALIGGSVWTHSVGIGQRVVGGTILLITECMKTEVPIEAPVDGVVTWLRPCGDTIEADDPVAALDVDD